MQTIFCASLTAFLVWTTLAHPGTEPETILEKAIKAMGGEERMSRLKASTWKAKSTVYSSGIEIVMTEEGAVQLPHRYRLEVTQEVSGNKNEQIIVIKDDQGWTQTGGRTVELPKQFLIAQREENFARWVVAMPVLLKDKAFTLSPLGELKVGDRPAVGIRVSREGRPDLNIFFDKQKGMPLKSETRVKEPGREVVYEFLYNDYKEFEGLQLFTRMTWNKDGKRFGEKEWSEIRPQERLDENLFARP